MPTADEAEMLRYSSNGASTQFNHFKQELRNLSGEAIARGARVDYRTAATVKAGRFVRPDAAERISKFMKRRQLLQWKIKNDLLTVRERQ